VTFDDWMDQEELVSRAARADVILGSFGTTPQSLMTVQNKIYEGLAMGKPVITGDSPAVRRVLIHGEHVYLCERENPLALAEAIRTLKKDQKLRQYISQKGRHLYLERFTPRVLGFQFKCYLEDLLSSQKREFA
jgi:glycosyltransferase involved in cell wall biosynthesis